MMNTRWHDLTIDRLPDGGIHLEQQGGCDEPSVIHLHPEQILFIARRLCGMKSETAEKVVDLERRIAVLTDKLQDFVCDKHMRSSVLGLCDDGQEHIARLDALLDLALEFDGGRLEPEEHAPSDCEISPPARANDKLSKTHPRAIATASVVDDKQLGLAV